MKFSRKIIGSYKRKGWAVKYLENIQDDTDGEELGTLKKAVLEANNNTFFPVFMEFNGEELVAVYFISEDEEQINLIPHELARPILGDGVEPFKYELL